jgi:hypothetical protein
LRSGDGFPEPHTLRRSCNTKNPQKSALQGLCFLPVVVFYTHSRAWDGFGRIPGESARQTDPSAGEEKPGEARPPALSVRN